MGGCRGLIRCSGKLIGISKFKTSALQWCLSEAMRDDARETRKQAEAISIQLDERHSRLLVKYHTCNHNLQVRVDVLALLQNVG